MFDVLSVLSAISDVKAVYDTAQGIFGYLEKKLEDLKNQNVISPMSFGAEKLAIEKTFQEWQEIVSSISPKIEEDSKNYKNNDIYRQIDHLSYLCKKYSYLSNDLDLLKIRDKKLLHTAISITPDENIKVYLGKSPDSSFFNGEALLINRKNNTVTNFRETKNMNELPTFKVTMLGDSDVGKTIFMAFMYTSLCANTYDFSIRASLNQHNELQSIVTNLYSFGNPPLGTQKESKYNFELFFRNKPIAKIDWVDYKGGAMNGGEEEKDTKFLIDRLKNSDAVISMVSLSGFETEDLDSLWAKTQTKITTMNTLLRNAMYGGGNIKTVLYVRTKSDEVTNDENKVDLEKALQELIIHLGENSFNIGNIHHSAAIPVSSAKITKISDKPATYSVDKKSRPMNVEWVLFIVLACLFQHEFDVIDKLRQSVTKELLKHTRSAFWEAILGKKNEEITAQARLQETYIALTAIKESIDGIMKAIPKGNIKIVLK